MPSRADTLAVLASAIHVDLVIRGRVRIVGRVLQNALDRGDGTMLILPVGCPPTTRIAIAVDQVVSAVPVFGMSWQARARIADVQRERYLPKEDSHARE